MQIEVALVYRPANGKPLSLVSVQGDDELLRRAALAALAQQEAKAVAFDAKDQTLAAIERQELERLRQTLDLLIPGLLQAETVM